MRPVFIVGILIGIIMVYFGYMGSAGFGGLLALPGTQGFEDDFLTDNHVGKYGMLDEYPVWMDTGTAGTNIGYIRMDNAATNEQDGITLSSGSIIGMAGSSQVTAEFRIRWSSTDLGKGRFLLYFYNKIFCFVWNNTAGGILSYDGNIPSGGVDKMKVISNFVPTANQWYKFTVQADAVASSLKIFKDNIAYGTLGGDYNYAGYSFAVVVGGGSFTSGGSVDVDYVQIQLSIVNPTGDSGPLHPITSGGTLSITTYMVDVNNVQTSYGSASFQVSGPNGFSATWTSDSNGLCEKTGLTAGSYSFSASLSGYTFSASPNPATVTNGETTQVTCKWTNNDNPNPNPFDFLAWLKSIIDNAMVKQVMLYGGICLTALSCIGLVIPKGRHNGYSHPPQRY